MTFLFIKQDDPLFEFFRVHSFALKNKTFSPFLFDSFRRSIHEFYLHNKREFSWRNAITPYRIVVSEIMLQQTQTQRVEQKFDFFLQHFPDFESLACAELSDVLRVWVGLGYNRRARVLHAIAQQVVKEWGGKLPSDVVLLETLYGIGPATAASIVAFAFNKPTIFIETNIRAVFLHIFFNNEESISDVFLMPLVEAALDVNSPREWYYALMDYGVIIKKIYENPAKRSKHYVQQPKFEGSDRQIRGGIVKLAARTKMVTVDQIQAHFSWADVEKIAEVIDGLVKDGLVKSNGKIVVLA